jgi:excisionase family DNA binding protein
MALGVSLRTVDRMLAAGEISSVRMRGWSVRFCLSDVVEGLRNGNRKFGRRADTGFMDCKGGGR